MDIKQTASSTQTATKASENQPDTNKNSAPFSFSQLMIRTMAGDLEEINGGKTLPSGAPKKIPSPPKAVVQTGPASPPKVSSAEPLKHATPPSDLPIPRPVQPSVGQTLPKAPMPSVAPGQKPTIPPPPTLPKNVSTQPPIKTPPPAPLAPALKTAAAGKPSQSLGKKIGLIFSALIIIALSVGAWLYWPNLISLISPSPTPWPTLTPTPIASGTPIPSSSLFIMEQQQVITASLSDQSSFLNALQTLVKEKTEPAGTFTQLLFNSTGDQSKFLKLNEVAAALPINLFSLSIGQSSSTAKLIDYLDSNSFSFFLYSQSSTSSDPFAAQATFNRLGLVVALKNASDADQLKTLLTQNEIKLPALLQNILADKNLDQAQAHFSNSNYQGIAIRYFNFIPDTSSIDYAIVNNKLLISTSKESMRSAINRTNIDYNNPG